MSSNIRLKNENILKIIGSRLKIVRDGLQKGSQAQFAEELGLTQTTLSKYEKGTSEIPDHIKIKLREYGINLHWLISGEGNMLISQEKALEKSQEGYKVPLLQQKASCGPGQNWEDEQNIEEYIDIFSMIPRLVTGRLYALCVQGSSMIGVGIQEGDYVLFDSRPDQITRDGNYVFALDGDVVCKRLEYDKLSKVLKIFSVREPDVKKAEFFAALAEDEAKERLHIFGRVVGWIHPSSSAI